MEEKSNRTIYRKTYVQELFNSIAQRYDFLNHLLSYGIDYYWRAKAVKILSQFKPQTILDVATGTADFAIAAAKLHPEKIIGIDISENMLECGKSKVAKLGLNNVISLEVGYAEKMPFDNNCFDAIICAFGVRNFENLETALQEFYRTLNKNGVAVILEFSKPNNLFIKVLYKVYFKYIVPFVGGLISKNKSAYKYLPSTVEEFPYGKEFCKLLNNAGFLETNFYPLTFGISTIYIAKKYE